MAAVAAIDCGTNSIKLLIADLPRVLHRTSHVVRLGQDVDRTGVLAEEALARTFAALEEFVGLIADHDIGPERIRFAATSATRDAANAEVFTTGVHDRLGVWPEVLSGAEEAALGFAGATMFLGAEASAQTGDVLVVDIGGGSTELVLGRVGSGPRHAISLDIGSVRLTERYLGADPPSAAQVARCLAEIDAELHVAEVIAQVEPVVAGTVLGTSGTVKTVAAAQLELPFFDRDAIDGVDLEVTDTIEWCARLTAMSVAERLQVPSMHPGRADVIGAGALIWSRILARTGVERWRVSEADLLYGLAAGIS